jgi:hypothetical protein
VGLSRVGFRLLRSLNVPASVSELAGFLGESTTRLYDQVRLLERLGLIEVVECRQVSSNMERLYRRAADRYEIANQPGGRRLQAGIGRFGSSREPRRIRSKRFPSATKYGDDPARRGLT